nr:MAG TPA: hypothetical protein [Caudoviricetes sp.]DAW73515.1 MAG TPA: hypothetical protein [Caudoviricetes sp.]
MIKKLFNFPAAFPFSFPLSNCFFYSFYCVKSTIFSSINFRHSSKNNIKNQT